MNVKKALSLLLGSFLFIVTLILLAQPAVTEAVGAFPYATGGTGTTTPSVGQLAFWGSSFLTGTATTTASCSGATSCSTFTIIGASPVTISSSAGAGSWPFTPSTNFGVAVQSTSTPIWDTAGFMASSTSYLATTTIYTQNDDGFKVVSTASNHIAQFVNLLASAAHASFCNLTTGCTTSDGTDYGIDPSGNARILNHEATSFYLRNNNTLVFEVNQNGMASSSLLFATNASTTNATTTSFGFTGLKDSILSTNHGGAVVATTSIGCNFISPQTCNYGTGSVTSIVGGTGLNGGTITTAGTLSLVSYLATSSAETRGQIPYWTSSAGTPATLGSVATTSQTLSSSFSTTGTFGALIGGTSGTLSGIAHRCFSYATSTWTGTTTVPLETGFGETWNNVTAYTNVGTLNFQIGYGSASTTMYNASTTNNVNVLTPNNTMTAGNKVKIDIGTPASSPTVINVCVQSTL